MLDCEFVPAKESASRRVMVVLHGLGDSMEGYRELPLMLRLPWLNYQLVNAPDPYYGGFSWFDIYGDRSPGIERSRIEVTGLINHLVEQGYQSSDISLLGFSQGCLMTIDVGLRYPHPLACLVGISGWVHEPEKLLAELSPVARDQRLLVTHGTRDPLIPAGPVKTQHELLKKAGIQLTYKEYNKEHTIAGEAEFSDIRSFVQKAYNMGA
ncbi:MAG: hypothetical protein SFY81_08865 [Verrucomicrobiota bacterium]|nr:hypothetical protein [Verrucomicrobiota bacterium]